MGRGTIKVFLAAGLALGGAITLGAEVFDLPIGMLASIAVRVASAVIAFYLVARFGERKVLALGAMFSLMAFRQILTMLIQMGVLDHSRTTTTLSEVPGFLVTLLALTSIIYLAMMLVRYHKRIRTLEGLLPICASCKKIRLEDQPPEDDDSWVAVERYISDRSDAEFSHGFCPTCVDKLYPSGD